MGAQSILHYGAVKVRATGSGNLRMTLQGYQDVRTQTLTPIVMSDPRYRQERVLANFVSEQGRIRIETTAIDEVFDVGSITLFVKPLYSEYPQ